ncbi:hypothetical protein ABIE09_002365 [Lysobacter enzymogenes]|uniref:hypothetical protein n=1 Tax=Lysobacter enzymogenes TaxID=69 RepID=UPI003394C566
MTIESVPENATLDRLRRSINWQVGFPDYVFAESASQGFFVIDEGVFTSRGFLDFMLSLKAEVPLITLVRLHGQPAQDLFFTTSDANEIADLRVHLAQGPLDLFGSKVVVSSASMEWIAYEEANEGFAVLAVFDEQTWKYLSSVESGVWDYATSAEQVATKLLDDKWHGWEPDFLRQILNSYRRKI